MVLSPAASSHHTRVVHGSLTWPAVRGERLLRALTTANCSQEEEQEQDDQFSADFPYELELCVPTAGHLALVLMQRTPGVQLNPSLSHSTTTPLTPTTPALVYPRVVYVLDAIPPSYPRREARDNKTRKNNTPGAQLPPQQVDELELLQELFASHTRATGSKEGSVLIKAPLLCARFDCRVVSIRFIRSEGNVQKPPKLCRSGSKGLNESSVSFNSSSSSLGATTSSRVVKAAAPLRCIVAREDGMAYLWEWQADLFQWVFLNKLCFLENPNLKWTRPVKAFTTCDAPLDSKMSGFSVDTRGNSGNGIGSSGAAELVWWSTATKHEPKLKVRRLRLERATDALRATDVVVGSAFIPKPLCNDVVKLLSSKLGLFAISKTQGIFFRSSVASIKTVAMDWHQIFSLDEASTAPDMSQIMVCVHTVTGEIVVLLREPGEIYLVTPKPPNTSTSSSSNVHENGSCTMLFARKLTTLAGWQQFSSTAQDDNNQAFDVLDVAAHRHVFLVLTRSVLCVYTLIAGKLLETVSLPNAIASSSPQRRCKFWTILGSASSVGLWAPCGFWTIRLPLAKVVAVTLYQPQSAKQENRNDLLAVEDPEAAFQAVKDYGTGDLHLEAVRYALDVLERVAPSAMDPTQSHPEAWAAMWHTVSSPAFLLALLDNRATSEHVVYQLAQHVSAIYSIASGIRSYGRLDVSGATTKNENHLLRLTPANLESLHHLSNWIVLAKRKLARLEVSSGDIVKSSPSVSSPEGSGSCTFRAMGELTAVLANEDDLSIAQDGPNNLQRKDSVVDPEDARNFRLSRKLRPMSSLRFAAGCSMSSERQGRQWLLQLESFLLDGVAFKDECQSGTACRVVRSEATPSHRLFHTERVLADFRHVTASSFSKHMYLESMSRLYLLYEPESLLPFIRYVERFCPRLFLLSGHQPLARSHAERAFTLFPPLEIFTNKILQFDESNDGQAAKASLLAYVDLLSYCGHHSEACRALLQCHLYEESKHKFLLLQKSAQDVQNFGDDEQVEVQARVTASNAVYFLLLEYCINHCNSTELNVLLMLKPANVDMLHVLRALRTAFSSIKNQRQQKSNRACAIGIAVGELRPVLAALMQQRRSGVAT